MNITEFIEKRNAQLRKIIEDNIPLKVAVLDVAAAQSQRIFIDGENTSGGTIGQYDTSKPLYVNPDKAPRKTGSKVQGIQGLTPTKGKTGEHTFKNGNVHKTTFLNNYKEFRNRIGRRIDRVNLSLFNDLQSDFSSLKVSGPNSAHNPEKISAHEYHLTLKRDSNVAKKLGLEKKYGTIFKLTSKEKERFHSTIQFEVAKIFAS